MKNTLLFLFLLTIISCKKEKSELAKNNIVRDQYQNLYGNWVGDFVTSKSDSLADENVDFVYSNKINLVIKKIENNKVYVACQCGEVDVYFIVHAERRDVNRVLLEYKPSKE